MKFIGSWYGYMIFRIWKIDIYIYTFNVVILIYYIYVYIFIYVISIPYITKPFRLQSQYGISRNVAFTFVDLNKNHALLSIPLTQQICFFHEPPRQVDNFCRHFCWLGNFLKEMTLNIVKGFLPPLISCCNNGAVPLANFLIYVFLILCLFFFKMYFMGNCKAPSKNASWCTYHSIQQRMCADSETAVASS